MRAASLWLVLVALHVCGRADCRPRHRQRARSTDPGPGAGTGPGGSGRSGPHRGQLAFFSVGPHVTRSLVTPVSEQAAAAADSSVRLFDGRRKRLLCVDIKGQLYKSRQKDRGRCLLRTSLDEHRDLLSRVVQQGGRGQAMAHERPLLGRLTRRRRSEEVNPSDPLRTESHPAPPVKEAEPNQAGAVSKETISSCDDPLRVLRPNGHGSPVKTNIADRAEHQ